MSSDLGATSKDIWFLEERGSDFLTLSSRDRQRRGVFRKIKHLTLTSIPLLVRRNKQIQVFGLRRICVSCFFFGCSQLWCCRPMCVVEPTFVEILMHGHLDLRNNKKLPGWPSPAKFGGGNWCHFWWRNLVIVIPSFFWDLSDTYMYMYCYVSICVYVCVTCFFCGEVSVFVLSGR